MIKFTRNDLKDERTLERLLRRITEDLEGLGKIQVLQQQIKALASQVASQREALTERLTAAEGALSKALRTSPADVAVYDEETNTWITSSNESVDVTGDLLPATDDAFDLGSATRE